jgi:hypothetical protein
MDTKRVLELVFTTTTGKETKINIENPKEPVVEADVKAAMDKIVAANVFLFGTGEITGIKGARIVERSTTDVNLA